MKKYIALFLTLCTIAQPLLHAEKSESWFARNKKSIVICASIAGASIVSTAAGWALYRALTNKNTSDKQGQTSGTSQSQDQSSMGGTDQQPSSDSSQPSSSSKPADTLPVSDQPENSIGGSSQPSSDSSQSAAISNHAIDSLASSFASSFPQYKEELIKKLIIIQCRMHPKATYKDVEYNIRNLLNNSSMEYHKNENYTDPNQFLSLLIKSFELVCKNPDQNKIIQTAFNQGPEAMDKLYNKLMGTSSQE